MDTKYYYVENGASVGPFSLDELREKNINGSTMVWYDGLTAWTPAKEVSKLAPLFIQETPAPAPAPAQPKPAVNYYAMINGNRIGPMHPAMLVQNGMRSDTMVWCEGLPDWVVASSRADLLPYLNGVGGNLYGNFGNPNSGNIYNNGNTGFSNYGSVYKSQKGIAVFSAIVTFLFSCIGLIFGIMAIINAGKADKAHAMGDDESAIRYNRTCRTNYTIALIFAGIGILFSVFVLSDKSIF